MPDQGVAFAIMGVSTCGVIVLLALAAIVSARFAEDAALPLKSRRRARELFLSKLTATQRRTWRFCRRFDVTAAGGRQYTITSYRPFNIRTQGAVFCVQIEGEIPIFDKLLAQKLLVETDEQLFLQRANIRTYSRAWVARVTAAREAA